MFFYISHKTNDNFPCHHWFDKLCISVDEGWTLKDNILYKGYVDNADIHQLNDFTGLEGNFCAIEYRDGKLNVISNRCRAFRIYDNSPKFITNLYKDGKPIWSDNYITIEQDLSVKNKTIDIVKDIPNQETDYNDVLDFIDNRLANKTQEFLKNNQLPIRVFLTGGADTILVYSYLSSYTNNFEYISEYKFEFDYFFLKNRDYLKHHVELTNQLHHWREPCVLVSGAPGDEFTLRNPAMSQEWADYHGKDLITLVSQEPDCYMYKFFQDNLKPKEFVKYENKKHLVKQLCNQNLNDPQHWHLGNTLTWTPLRDIEIFKQIAMLPFDQAIQQILNAQIAKDLIQRRAPHMMQYMSKYKNYYSHAPMIPFYKDKKIF